MINNDIQLVLERKTIEMENGVRSIRRAIYSGERDAISSKIILLERDLEAFKRLVNGAFIGEGEAK